jgi:micrococcal nuclease
MLLLLSCRDALPRNTGVVDAVVDGDTIDVRIGDRDERVRLIGIDTPETHVTDGPPECFGPEASTFTASLLPVGTEVRLERDIVGRDDYGRLLAYVYLLDDGSLVNETLARQGYARPLTIAPNDALAARFVAATVAAEADRLGLWAACGGR